MPRPPAKGKPRGRPFTSTTARQAAAIRDPNNMRRGDRNYYVKLAKLPRFTVPYSHHKP